MNKAISLNISILLLCTLLAVFFTGFDIAQATMADLETDSQEHLFSQQTDLQNQEYTLTITGNSHFSEAELLKSATTELQMFKQRGYRKADIDDAAFQMRSAYLQVGFAFAFVDYTYEQKPDFIDVTFTVEEGPRVFIEKIGFNGNKITPTDTLLGFFQTTSKPLTGQLKMFFVESDIKSAAGRIRNYLLGEGFFDAVVKSPDLSFTENQSGVDISFQITEGPQYFIEEVILSGEIIPALADELENIKNNFTGKSYFVRRKLMLRSSLEEAYDAIGYADAKFIIESVHLDQPGRITLLAEITSNEEVRISDVLISGNIRTREKFIRDRMQMKPGDVYTNAKRRKSFRELFDSGLFSKVDIKLSNPLEDGNRNLEVKVEELPIREVYVEPGWGSYEKLRLRAGVYEKNLFGTGRNARIDGLISTKSESFTVRYTDPWLLQTDIIMNIPLFYDHRDEPSYTSEEKGISVLFSKKFGKKLTLSTGYLYKFTQLFDLTDVTRLQDGEDDYNKGTVGIQAVWDTRNDIFYPSGGLRFSSSFDISLPALGSDLEFGRITLGCRYFIELPKEFIIGLRATTGLIVPIGDQTFIPISERFFNGGDNTVRSYKYSQLGPKDANNEPVGGLGHNVFSIELRKRIYKNLATTFYIDAGNVSPNRSLMARGFLPYTDRSDLLDDTLDDFFSEFKFGIGIGFQYLLPVGPVRIDVAYNPDPEEIWNEDFWTFHFSLGMAF